MKYCVSVADQDGTIYHEFYKGRWDEETFWKEDSLLLHDDILCQMHGFEDALTSVCSDYDPFDATYVSRQQWQKIGESIPPDDKESLDLYAEIDEWVQNVFATEDCFTIIGI